MKKNSTLGELLYIVSNYEKGRIKSFGLWHKKYVESLQNSLDIMIILTDLIDRGKNISEDEMLQLQKFIWKNRGTIFPNKINFSPLFMDDNDVSLSSNNYKEVLKLISDIIFEIQTLLEVRTKKYKIKISYLLKALHNLPRVFLNPNDWKIMKCFQ